MTQISSLLRELPPEFDDAAKEGMRAKARRTKPDHESMGAMSDEWVANELRMLSRNDLWHEAFCCAGRDRIMRLSLKVERLEAELKEARRCKHTNRNGTGSVSSDGKIVTSELYCADCGKKLT